MRWAFVVVMTTACATAPPPASARRQPGWKIGVSVPAPGATGAIAGRVVDAASGEPLFPVTIIASSPALQGTRSEFTDQAGSFRLTDLPAGSYELLAIYGDAKLRVNAVPVDVGGERWVAAALSLAPGELIRLGPCRPPNIEPGTATQKTVIDHEMLKNVPW